jgi:DUF4097 and DUF4098 domain-containing protein YvlB
VQEQWEITEPRVIDVGNVRKVKVALFGGQVNVLGHDESTARVEVHSVSGKELKVTIDGDTLEINHPQLRWDNFMEVFSSFRGKARADISILVPRNVELKLGVVSAEGLIAGLHSDARVSNVSGSLILDNVRGDLELNTVSGELSVRNHSGRITANTVSGDLTASGYIESFSANGVSGNVVLDILGLPDSIENSTVSGDLTARLPSGPSARFTVNTVSGSLQLDDVHMRRVHGKGFSSSSGPLDGFVIDVRANSVSGDVSVVRAAPTADASSGADAGAGAPA